ncbi:MAG: hypothetical protein AAGE84_09935 [Cyanobacteria bacterium P01_G01_bin.39]
MLFSAASSNAEAVQSKQSKSSTINHQRKTTSDQDQSSLDSATISNSKITQNIATESLDNGSPALRRQPIEGERFEPKRIPLTLPFPKEPYRASPSVTIINPSAYGAAWGNAGIGVGFQERARFTDQSDGVIGIGFGLGNPRKNVGAQVGISLVDVSAPFRDGAINLKLHRRLPEDFAIALGVQGLVKWGETDGGSSVFGVATKRIKLRQDRTKAFSEIYTTLGVGGGQFRLESDINEGNETIGVFGSIAIKLIQPVGFVAEWTGQDLTIGIPLVPFRKIPIVIVPAVTDITGSAGDGTRFVIGLGYTFSF